jgi:hypothetical protein
MERSSLELLLRDSRGGIHKTVRDTLMIVPNGSFTLARYRGRFHTKLARLVMKKQFFKQNVLA